MDFTKSIVKVFDQHAQKYQDKYMDVSLYCNYLNEFCHHVTTKNAKILDVACGPGNVSQYLLKKRPDFKILGIDLSEKMIELARINNPSSEFLVMDCRDIKALQQKFDGIVCAFCFPYLTQNAVEKLITDSASLLTKNGVIYVSFMNGNYIQPIDDNQKQDDHMYIFKYQLEYVIELFLNAQFTLIDMGYMKSPDNASYITNDAYILARSSSDI